MHKEIDQLDNLSKVENEFGDVLFSMINYARFIGVDPEMALEKTNKKFIGRFTFLENKIKEKKLDFSNLSLEQMDAIWEESKEKFP